ncbi:MAG: hypothetical protein R3B09_11645 [Nannocystaceae bacterium]
MTRTTQLLTFALVTLAAACSSEKKSEPKAEAMTVTLHKCMIQVAPAGDPAKFEGTAQGEDETVVLEAAWTDVCAKLPEADKPTCKDDGKWEVMISGASGTLDGKTNYNKNVVLKARVETKDGSAESDKTMEDACKAATIEACKAAGAEGDCIAAGTHQKRGESSSTSTQRVAPKT